MKKKKEINYDEKRLFDYACWYITRYPSSRLRMKEKLSEKNENLSVVEKVLMRLESFGYIDDRAVTESVVRSFCRRGYGKSRIILKLREKKITDRKMIDDVLQSEGAEEKEAEGLKKIIEKRYEKYDTGTPPGRKRFIDYLLRRGFRMESILNELRTRGII